MIMASVGDIIMGSLLDIYSLLLMKTPYSVFRIPHNM